jgi:hypothetical protein
MSLAQVQQMMLQLTISPNVSDELYHDPEAVGRRFQLANEELQAVQRLPRRKIEAFQFAVASKRLSKFAMSFVSRTLSLFPHDRLTILMREYIRINEMRKNGWSEYLNDFLDYMTSKADPKHARMVAEIASFEKWLYACSSAEPAALPEAPGLMLAPNVFFGAFPFPAELLIRGPLNVSTLEQEYGRTGYVLCCPEGGKLDLYEIDEACFRLLSECREPIAKECLVAAAYRIAEQYPMETEPAEIVEELLEMNLLVSTKGWDE